MSPRASSTTMLPHSAWASERPDRPPRGSPGRGSNAACRATPAATFPDMASLAAAGDRLSAECGGRRRHPHRHLLPLSRFVPGRARAAKWLGSWHRTCSAHRCHGCAVACSPRWRLPRWHSDDIDRGLASCTCRTHAEAAAVADRDPFSCEKASIPTRSFPGNSSVSDRPLRSIPRSAESSVLWARGRRASSRPEAGTLKATQQEHCHAGPQRSTPSSSIWPCSQTAAVRVRRPMSTVDVGALMDDAMSSSVRCSGRPGRRRSVHHLRGTTRGAASSRTSRSASRLPKRSTG